MFSRFLSFLFTLPCVVFGATDARTFSSEEVAVITHHFTPSDQEAKRDLVVIEEETTIGIVKPGVDWKSQFRKSVSGSDKRVQEAIEDFIVKNSTESSLAGLEIPSRTLVILPEKTVRETFADRANDGWTKFRQKYGNVALWRLSRVGFSEDRQLAIYYVAWQGDWLAGRGEIFVVRKKGNLWEEDKDVRFAWGYVS